MTPEIYDLVCAEALRRYPDEACGFIFADQNDAWCEFFACRNIQDALHARDPDRYPRTAATAYVMDPEDQRRAQERAANQGWRIAAIVHSHPEHDAYFSDEDQANAAPWGEPLFANLTYVVVSVYGRSVREIKEFIWNDDAKKFLERQTK